MRNNISNDISNELELITEAVTSAVDPIAIYLFGSYAYGTPREDSDIDIYVVVPDDVPNTYLVNVDIESAMCRKPIRAVDLLVARQSAFNRKKDSFFFEKNIYNKGIKIYP